MLPISFEQDMHSAVYREECMGSGGTTSGALFATVRETSLYVFPGNFDYNEFITCTIMDDMYREMSYDWWHGNGSNQYSERFWIIF